jgi:hypothetical protein
VRTITVLRRYLQMCRQNAKDYTLKKLVNGNDPLFREILKDESRTALVYKNNKLAFHAACNKHFDGSLYNMTMTDYLLGP